jgi:hypothetical protein
MCGECGVKALERSLIYKNINNTSLGRNILKYI